MPDQSSILAALARAAAEEEGHPCGGFTVQGRVLSCPHGVTYEVSVPNTSSTASRAGDFPAAGRGGS